MPFFRKKRDRPNDSHWTRKVLCQTADDNTDTDTDYVVYRAGDWPIYPPPPPREILAQRPAYSARLAAIRFAYPRGVLEDSPLFALYRLYEYFLLDEVIDYRNLLEYFWRQKTWPVQAIPDPCDDDPERYAFLAGCTFLLVRSFNQRVRLGLDRQRKAILMLEEVEMLRNRPDHLRTYETAPAWADKVPPLADVLVVPTEHGVVLSGWDDPRANPEFKTKNILLWTPHISFT